MAKRYEVSPSKITEWMRELEEKAAQAFEKPSDNARDLKKVESENKRLLQKVGQLTVDCDFFCDCLRGCRTQIEIIEMESHRPAGISRNRFCKYMKLNRSTLYYKERVRRT